ncbi:LysR family transcriptional regulator [Nocardioides sp.]|uniref:LysR family transcriptional regulator n=1 Tax=Nocardioides sp. TaxID=35761 RepID=UPI0035296A45
MIDLATLRSLRSVATTGSVSAAALELGFTPSAVSQQVKRLERDTGVRLLERVGRGVALTPAGRELAARSGRLLVELETLESELQSRSEAVSGTLRVVAFSTAMRGLVADAAARVTSQHPRLRLELDEGEPWAAVSQVAGGGYDLGVVHSWGDVPIDVPEALVRHDLGTDVADVLVPSGHRLATAPVLRPADLLTESWVATPEGTICRQWLERMYDGTGAAPRIGHRCAEFDSQIALVARGLGIALVPRLGRSPLPASVIAVPATEPVPSRQIVAVHRRSMHAAPAVQAVLAALTAPPARSSEER